MIENNALGHYNTYYNKILFHKHRRFVDLNIPTYREMNGYMNTFVVINNKLMGIVLRQEVRLPID